MIEKYFFDLLKVAIGNKKQLTSRPRDEEWALLYDIAKKHALGGITFKGIEKLSADHRPPMQLFLRWSGMAIQLKEKNEDLLLKCVEVTEKFCNDGFNACVLKGQGNLAYYPSDLGCYRTPGDIDVWLKPAVSQSYSIRSVVDYVKGITSGQFVCYIHIDFPSIRGTKIEVHIRPSFLCSPLRNRRLQRWYREEGELRENTINYSFDGQSSFPVPSKSFNAIYQLLHIYKHLFEEGIGLRQILDYYFVLGTGFSKKEKVEIMNTLSSFGMKKFTGAMMYVLQSVFAMADEFLLCAPEAKEGKFLLGEVMQAGNFGKYDERISHSGGKYIHAWEKLKHNFRLVGHYPEEVIWEPVFRVYHWVWRRFKLWQFE